MALHCLSEIIKAVISSTESSLRADEIKLWLTPSANQRRNPCSGLPAVYPDLSTRHDWPVKKGFVLFVVIANQIEGEFETHFRSFVESVGCPEQGSLRCFADGTNQSLVIVCTQATAGTAPHAPILTTGVTKSNLTLLVILSMLSS